MERMLRIHQIIKDAPSAKKRYRNLYPNATDIANELEVSYKTVVRDINFMRDRLNLPIEYHQVNHGYYYSQEVASFPTIQISEGELFSLLIARKAIASYQGTSFEEPLKKAFRKLADSLPKSINIHLDDWDRAISFHSASVPIVNLETFNQLAQSVIHHEQLRIWYQKPTEQEASERLIDPIQLVHVGGEWYLLGWCYKRKKVLTFHILRIKKIKKTNCPCAEHKEFSAEKYLHDSFSIYTGETAYHITLRIDKSVANYFRERSWHSSQKNEELRDGNLKVHFTLNSLEEIQRWILSWGGLICALKPKELVQRIHDAAQQTLKKHSPK